MFHVKPKIVSCETKKYPEERKNGPKLRKKREKTPKNDHF